MVYRRSIAAVFAMSAALVPTTPRAEPHPGDAFPYIAAGDLTGRWHTSRELRGRRALVVVITSPDAGWSMRQWLTQARAVQGPPDAIAVSLLALDLPFYAPDGLVYDRARSRVPRFFWNNTWLDRSGGLRRRLGLQQSHPASYVFVVDRSGRVTASAFGPPTTRNAPAIWASLRAP